MSRTAAPAVAVIGMSAHFPQAPDIAAFWRLLVEGRDAVTTVPAERWNAEELYDATPGRRGKMNTRWGAFIDDIRGFDASFFGISPREARDMDPQQRLLLEVAWATFESAGYTADRIAGSATGVFVGIGGNDYSMIQFGRKDHRSTVTAYSGTGQAHSIAPNRISYALDLRGPSFAIDTACSSSLVAIHQAVRSLAVGESKMALAGGVNIVLAPEVSIAFSHAQMLAADGRCKSFDARADGYVRGEGCGLVLLKLLDDALRDGDPVHGVIVGSAINQDGRSNGLTAPNGRAQADVVRAALAAADIRPEQVGYVEAHGTGTPLGDPIEINALAAALERPDTLAPTLVGSVKTNIGHLECASGIAGFLKALLALRHEQVPANLHFVQLNPAIALGPALRIAATSTPWPKNGAVRYAGVSSYGFGGANAHVVLSDAPELRAPCPDTRTWHVVTLAAKTENALGRAAQLLREGLPAHESVADIAFTSTAGRTHFGHRYAVVVKSRSDLIDELDAIVDGRPSARVHLRQKADFARPRVGFLFTGQGSQYVGMGRELYLTSVDFRAAFDRCARVLDPLLEEPLATLFDGSDSPGAIDRTGNTQPALFALEYALAMTWIAWGVVPHALLGHSVGEFVAAAVGGMLTPEDAARLVAQRARMMQALPTGGAMAAILEPAGAVEVRLAGYAAQVSIAALNGPASTVISGNASAVEAIVARAVAEGAAAQRLNVSHAFHSPLMEPMLDAWERAAANVRTAVPHTITISNVTGLPHQTAPTPAYWRHHARQPVAFMAGIEALGTAECDVLLEIGPDATLTGLAKTIIRRTPLACFPSLRKGRDAWRTIGDATAALYVRNAPVDWRSVYRAEGRRVVALPSYPFEHQRYWFTVDTAADETASAHSDHTDARHTGHPLLGRRIVAAEPLFSASVSLDELPYLRDHQIEGRVMLPASAFVELALAAGEASRPGAKHEIANLVLRHPLVLEQGETAQIQTALHTTVLGDYEVQIDSLRGERWTPLAHALLRRHDQPVAPADGLVAAGERITGADLYAGLRRAGYEYGPAFAAVTKVERAGTRAVGTIVMPPALSGTELSYGFHPALLDACFHVAAATALDENALFIPASIEAVRMHSRPSRELRVFAQQRSTGDSTGIVFDLTIENAAGGPVASVSGLRAQRLAREKNPAAQDLPPAPIFDVAWTPFAIDLAARRGRCSLLGHGLRAERLADALRSQGWAVADPGSAAILSGDVIVDAGALDRSDDALPFELFPILRRALEARAAQLIVVTAGAQKVTPDDVVAPACTALWGAARTIAREHPELKITLLDLPSAAADDEARIAARVISGASRREEEVALRAGVLLHPSLTVRPASGRNTGTQPIPAGPYKLRSMRRGRLDGVRPMAVARNVAGPGQLVIEVVAAALNFRDVMKTLGMYPSTRPDGDWLGDECAGRVVDVGPDVHQFARGDHVVAFAPAAFGRYATTLAKLTTVLPRELDFASAAALPVAYGTSWYALNELARLRAGERVLIHAAAGGVGLAAVAVARKLGAEVFATAGSDEKRTYLQSLGVDAVFDSRSLDFVEAIRERTRGAGVDVVVNSLAGEALTATLSIVAPFGRFIEIGKKDIYANSPLPMRPLARNVAFFALDMDELLEQRPDVGGALLRGIVSQVADGSLPALPVTLFGLAQAERAFRMMAQARHIGKIVLKLPETASGGCAVVSGGFGGLGPPVAGWLHERGIGTIVLTGRSEPDALTRQAIEHARAAGVTIVCERMDVTDAESVAQTLRRVRESHGPITAIVHLAARLDDGIALQQTDERFTSVGAPKVEGVRHLHEQTLGDDLGLFVVFSSAGAVLGSPGQSTYTAANAYLEGFVHERRRAGLPGLCVHWGPWAEAGMAARTQRRNASGAVRSLTSAAAFAALSQAVEDDLPVATILDVDWSRWRQVVPDADAYPLVRRLLPAVQPATATSTNGAATNGTSTNGMATNGAAANGTAANGAANGTAANGAAKMQLAAIAPSERRSRLAAFIAGELAQVMEMDRARLTYDQPIRDLGVDSLMGLELQLRLEGELNVVIPRMALMQAPTIADLADIIAGVLEVEDVPSASAGSSVPRDRLRLICFPHAGAGADAFRALARDLRDDVEIVAIDYPGRGSHMTQPSPATMTELVEAIAADLQAKLAGPMAFLGHSLGALVAFEFIRQLERRGASTPSMLFVSSCAGPWAQRRAAAMSSLDDATFIERLREYNGTPGRVIDDIELMQAFLPTLRSDFAIAETYRPVQGATIAVPIVAIGGASDPHVAADELGGWAAATTSTFELAIVAGDHFHISSPSALAAKIRGALSLMHADAM